MRKVLKIVIPLALILLSFFIMRQLTGMKKEQPRKGFEPKAKVVTTQTVILGDIPVAVTAYGRVTSADPVDIYSEVTGTVMKGEVPFKPGQSFRKGDLLLVIDDRQLKMSINSVKSDLLNAFAKVLPEIKIDSNESYNEWHEYFKSINFDSLTPLKGNSG